MERIKLSIVVVIYNMKREAYRTLYSLSTEYQLGINENDYEVIVVDNGSSEKYSVNYLSELKGSFQYHYIENAPPSPAAAINYGVKKCRGKYVGLMIDGARIASPGILQYALRAFAAFSNPVVATLGWHIGPDIQRVAIEKHGYSSEVEDKLLESISWPRNGYRLFTISTLAGSSNEGWFRPISESSLLFMPRAVFDQLGGYDERFDKPGGGLVNLDMYKRACELSEIDLVVILGEGTFHQLHGGAMTSTTEEESQGRLKEWGEQYMSIRKALFNRPLKRPAYIGHIPPEALQSLFLSIRIASKTEQAIAVQRNGLD